MNYHRPFSKPSTEAALVLWMDDLARRNVITAPRQQDTENEINTFVGESRKGCSGHLQHRDDYPTNDRHSQRINVPARGRDRP